MGFPIRKSPDQSSFAAPRSLSQLITSFIGSWCQGIPLALLLAWPVVEVRQALSAKHLAMFCSLLGDFSSSNSNPLALGFEFVGDALCKAACVSTVVTSRIIHFYLVSLVELCRLIKEVSFAKIVIITLLIKSFPLLLPSHNCINNSQCSVFKVHGWVPFSRDSMKPQVPLGFQSISFWSGGPKWTRTIDLTIISRVL